MNTVYGVLVDAIGHASAEVVRQGAGGPELLHVGWASPAAEFRAIQPDRVTVDIDHDGYSRGEVVYLERNRGRLWAVAHVEDRVSPAVSVRVADRSVTVESDFYWSVSRFGGPELGGLILDSVALTASPARVCPEPVTFLPGMLDHRHAPDRWNIPSGFERELLTRAAVAHCDRRSHGGPLIVHDPAPVASLSSRDDIRTRGQLEIRSASQTLDVSESQRTIELVVMPYESPAIVRHHGRMVEEVCSFGAFDEAELRASTVRVNRDHQRERTVGRATDWDAYNPVGLVASIKVANTELGDETLQLARDDCLDCSAGFGVHPGGETWEGQRRRRLTRIWLDHVALTPDPAYHDARVLKVRNHV